MLSFDEEHPSYRNPSPPRDPQAPEPHHKTANEDISSSLPLRPDPAQSTRPGFLLRGPVHLDVVESSAGSMDAGGLAPELCMVKGDTDG